MELECPIPNLGQTSLNPDLRARVVLRYRDLLENLFTFPLWSTYYNDQVGLWLKAEYPQFVKKDLDLSASVVVNYLLQTYATSGKFLFEETRRDAFIRDLQNHRPTTYLLNYLATELETLPPTEECQSRLFKEVAVLVTRCLNNPEGRRIVDTAIRVDCLPEKLKTQFNEKFLTALQTRYAQSEKKEGALLNARLSTLEFNFYKNHKSSVAAYLKAVAAPLAFLNSTNVLGEVSRVFKAKVKGGTFPIENLFLASLHHLWPELTINIPRLSSRTLNNLRETACEAIREEIHILLEHTLVPKEKKEKDTQRASAEDAGWEQNLDRLCRTQDLKNIVLYYTGKEFVCFREDEVFKDMANHHTQKYPPDFLDKMEKRLATAKRSPGAASRRPLRGSGAERPALPSPVLNSPHSANLRAIISRKKGQEERGRYPSVDPFARQKDFDNAEFWR